MGRGDGDGIRPGTRCLILKYESPGIHPGLGKCQLVCRLSFQYRKYSDSVDRAQKTPQT
jgi:hypothetical protein